MSPVSGIPVLPADLCQQLLAMPLTEDERDDVASALISRLAARPPVVRIHLIANRNAPLPDRPQGV